MAHVSLAEFLEALDHDGQLARVGAEVEAELEAAEITRRVAAAGGPALLFQNVKGHRLAVVTNLLGTESRICRALGAASLAEVGQRISDLGRGGQDWLQRLTGGDRGTNLDRWLPKQVKSGVCQQIVKLASDVDLTLLPALKSWPGETARSLAGVAAYRHPDLDQRRLTWVEVQITGKSEVSLAWNPQHEAARFFELYRAKGEPMPVAIVLGGHPAYLLATASLLAAQLDAFVLAGLLRGQALELVKCRTLDLRVPADADIVLEGQIDPAAAALETPRHATAYGHYSLPQAGLRMRVTAITERTNAVFPAIVADAERWAIAKAVERLLLPLVKAAIPDLVDCNLSPVGMPQRFAFLSIRKRYAHQARKVASAVWGWEPLMHTKLVILVDEGVDVQDAQAVWRQVAANVHPGRDVFFHEGPADPPDHAAPSEMLGHAMGIDATAKLPGEHTRPWPEVLEPSEEVAARVNKRWAEYGIPIPG